MANGKEPMLKSTYYLDGYAVQWRGMGLNDAGEVSMLFACVDENGTITQTFSIARAEIKRREDVVLAAKDALGLFRGEAQLGEPAKTLVPLPEIGT